MLPIHSKPKPCPSIAANPQTSSLLFKYKILPLKISNILNENKEANQSKAGRIKRLVLTNEGRTKLSTFPDREFYAYPWFATHVDDGFIATLTDLYRERLRHGSEILDLMSSWINQDKKVEMEDGSFNAVLCTVSLQYLQQPEKYFQYIEGFTKPEVIRKLPTAGTAQDDKSPFSWFMKWLELFYGSDPFYAVIAYKNFKPVYERKKN
ncbi:hypothetical protein CRYUN_Cryun15aG0015200 [Craigia yunnanensis]